MKAHLPKLILVALAVLGRHQANAADAATSANYQLTNISLDAGGQRNGSQNYTNDVAIGMIAFHATATFSVINDVGYTATLNNPPIAFGDILSHPFDQPITIIPDSFLQNDFEIDGDTLRIYSVDANTQAHGSVVVNGANFIYSPPVAFEGIDRFNYRVIDSGGDVSEATVTMVVAPAIESQTLDTLALFKLPDGTYLLRYRYLKDFSEYHIEYTDNLEPPTWKTLEIVRAGGDGIASLIIQPNTPRRFYRAIVF